MTDKKWLELMTQCSKLALEHNKILKLCEAEYEARYGNKPSDVDDDYWIDSLHYGQGKKITIQDIVASASICNQQN